MRRPAALTAFFASFNPFPLNSPLFAFISRGKTYVYTHTRVVIVKRSVLLPYTHVHKTKSGGSDCGRGFFSADDSLSFPTFRVFGGSSTRCHFLSPPSPQRGRVNEGVRETEGRGENPFFLVSPASTKTEVV